MIKSSTLPNTYKERIDALYEWDMLGFHDAVVEFAQELSVYGREFLWKVYLYHLVVASTPPNYVELYDIPHEGFRVAEFVDKHYERMLKARNVAA